VKIKDWKFKNVYISGMMAKKKIEKSESNSVELSWLNNFLAGIFSALFVLVATGQDITPLKSFGDTIITVVFFFVVYFIGCFVVKKMSER
jgi:hypothetical protein